LATRDRILRAHTMPFHDSTASFVVCLQLQLSIFSCRVNAWPLDVKHPSGQRLDVWIT
jgi:hypothetical protein